VFGERGATKFNQQRLSGDPPTGYRRKRQARSTPQLKRDRVANEKFRGEVASSTHQIHHASFFSPLENEYKRTHHTRPGAPLSSCVTFYMVDQRPP
jgi:hypothetical protein